MDVKKPPSKKIRTSAVAAIKKEDEPVAGHEHAMEEVDKDLLRDRFIAMFSEAEFQAGVSNSALKQRFGAALYLKLAPIINKLTAESRLSMSKSATGELSYSLVDEDVAEKFTGLDLSARMVYQVIEKAGDMGIWTKDIRLQTSIQQQALNKIFKALESRRLIKPVKSVTAKAKKLYMLAHLTPSKELTGGVWYSDLEFDHEFINELRTFLIACVRHLNGGQGVTLTEIRSKMLAANVSRVQLSLEEVEQLVSTLVYDYRIEEGGENAEGEILYIPAKRVSTMCDFKWWDVLDSDFYFRTVAFEDGVTLPPHEPHYHTA